MPQATSLAAAIMEKTGSEPELVRGDKGIFDVTVDGRLIFSKHETGRFPEHEEVLEQL
ncbi:MAG: Rdx family protein [Proteobacteria bacterium]|nr:Rdx family protein [Pseudomonadota bacterium]